jgi:arsenate reductase (thioredoxin)
VIPATKKRVLFVCIGNACRSQMAEAFARTYGSDVLVPASAGVAPARSVASDTIRAMDEKNIDLRDHYPKTICQLGRADFDIVVNMSGAYLPEQVGRRVIDWEVPDPVSLAYSAHCEVRDQIEHLVMRLILELRRVPRPQFRGYGSGRL